MHSERASSDITTLSQKVEFHSPIHFLHILSFFELHTIKTTLEFEVKMKNGHEYKTSWHRFFQSLKYYGNWPSKCAYLPPQT